MEIIKQIIQEEEPILAPNDSNLKKWIDIDEKIKAVNEDINTLDQEIIRLAEQRNALTYMCEAMGEDYIRDVLNGSENIKEFFEEDKKHLIEKLSSFFEYQKGIKHKEMKFVIWDIIDEDEKYGCESEH